MSIKINRHAVVIVSAIVAAVLILGVAAKLGHNAGVEAALANERHNRAIYTQGANDQKDKDDRANTAQEARNKAECAKENKYYSLLTPVQKKTVAVPSCTP